MLTFEAHFDMPPIGDGRLDSRELLEAAGQLGESQTKARIAAGGPAPDGEAWAEWSRDYAATRHSGQGLLFSEGALLDDIAARPPSSDAVAWGSGLIYARVHQEGYEDIPARPYLGISEGDAQAFEDLGLQYLAEASGL